MDKITKKEISFYNVEQNPKNIHKRICFFLKNLNIGRRIKTVAFLCIKHEGEGKDKLEKTKEGEKVL